MSFRKLIMRKYLFVLLVMFLTILSCEEPVIVDFDPPQPVEISGVTDSTVYDTAVTPTWDTTTGTTDEAVLTKDSVFVPGYQKDDTISEDGIYRITVTTTKTVNNLTAVSTANFMLNASLPSEIINTNAAATGTDLDIYFYEGPEFTTEHPLYTIWVEDMNGNFIQDLFVCNAPGTNVYPFTGWVARIMSVPYWTHKSCIEDPYEGDPGHDTTGMYLALPTGDGGPPPYPEGPIPYDLDAVSGATREVNVLLQTAREDDGILQFRVLLEVSQSWDYNAYYDSGSYNPGGQPSLVYGAAIDLSSDDKFYTMSLMGAGHALGDDGGLYDTSNHTTALDIVGNVIVHVKQ